jgi:hypothetical protein
VNLGTGGGGVFGKRGSEADGFGAEIVLDEVVTGGGGVALGEEEVEDVEDGFEAVGELGGGGDFEADVLVAYGALGADEALGDGDLGGEEGSGDLGDAEAADDFEGEGYTGWASEGGVAADEDEGELRVGDLVDEVEGRWLEGAGFELGFELEFRLVLAEVEATVAFEDVEGAVVGDAGEPGFGVVGDALKGPELKGLDHGVLDRILGDFETACAEDAGEVGDHAAELVAEEMVHELVYAGAGGFGRRCGLFSHGMT